MDKKIEEILNDFSYDVDSDHGDKLLPDGIKEYSGIIKKLFTSEVERIIGGDESLHKGWDNSNEWKQIRNELRAEQRNKLKELLK